MLIPDTRVKALTFNWHEPYLHMLAKTGHRFDVAEPGLQEGAVRRWDLSSRPIPANLSLVSPHDAMENLRRGLYNLVVCHNFDDLAFVADYPVPSVLIFHTTLSGNLAIGENTVNREDYLACVAPLAERADLLVFVSPAKRTDWGFPGGMVILPGIDGDEFDGYTGHLSGVLRVGNHMKSRDAVLGYHTGEKIVAGYENRLLGHNPDIKNSRAPKDFDELKACYANHRLYLNTTVDRLEDGYNLAMIEAMSTGMPVVSTANSTSPITDGVEGFVSIDVDCLRDRVDELLGNRKLAVRMGKRARRRALELFDMEKFRSAWNSAFESVSAKYGGG